MLRRVRYGVWNRAVRRLLLRELHASTRHPTVEHPVTVVLHADCNPNINAVFVEWLWRNFPDVHGKIVYRSLPIRPAELVASGAVVFWLQDPVPDWSQKAYEQALRVEEICRDAGVPMINRPSVYDRVDRINAAKLIEQAGFRTPRVETIENWDDLFADADDLTYPLVIRERSGHQRALFRVDTREDLADPRLMRLACPVRVEWIDVCGDDRYFRKYRMLVVGKRVLPHHLHIGSDWITRGGGPNRVTAQWAQEEELRFLSTAPPEGADFLRASQRFGLEVLGYDFGYSDSGETVVWEANPYPFIWFSGANGGGLYRAAAIHQAFASLLELYLSAAGHAVPLAVQDLFSGHPETEETVLRCLEPVVQSERFSVAEEIALRPVLTLRRRIGFDRSAESSPTAAKR